MAGLESSTRQQSLSTRNQISLSSSCENDDTNCSATLLNLGALNCPICCDALTSSIFQCDNGHVTCSPCCNKLRNKCPSCALPVGHIRCRAMERVIKSVIVPCPNAAFGCVKKFSYGKELTHEKECSLSRCSCPALNCDYTGSHKDLFSHFKIHDVERENRYLQFHCGEFRGVYFDFTEYTSVVMKEDEAGLLFVVQCFREPHGVYVTVSCIAPSAREVGEFSCHISTTRPPPENFKTTLEIPKVKRVRGLSSQTPEEGFMLVPSYLLYSRQMLKLSIRVNRTST